MNILVMGCGSIGRRHIKNLCDLGIKPITVYDPQTDLAQNVAKKTGAMPVDSVPKAYATNPELVLITTPTHVHMETAIEAAQRGCHLFIEKPLSHTLQHVECLQKIVHQKNLKTYIGCDLHFHAGIRWLKNTLQSGKIGHPLFARLYFGHYLPSMRPGVNIHMLYAASRALGGGVLLDSGVHEVEYISWLLDSHIVEARGEWGTLGTLGIQAEDYTRITLKFENGTEAEIHLNYLDHCRRRSCEIIGSAGTAIWESRGKDPIHCTGKLYQNNTDLSETPVHLDPNHRYVDEMKNVIDWMRNDAPAEQDLDRAIDILTILLTLSQRSPSVYRREPYDDSTIKSATQHKISAEIA